MPGAGSETERLLLCSGREAVQPRGDATPSSRACRRTHTLCVSAKHRDGKAWHVGKLHGVSDQPSLKPAPIRLRVELEAERRPTEGKCLIGTGCGGREAFRAGRQVEGIAVPVQHVDTLQVAQRPIPAGVGQVTGAQPISFAEPGATRAPRARAMSCAPRQMPSVGAPVASRPYRSSSSLSRIG